MFYWSHLLYLPFWVLVIIHAPNFWKWFIVPCIIFIIEKVYPYYTHLRTYSTYFYVT